MNQSAVVPCYSPVFISQLNTDQSARVAVCGIVVDTVHSISNPSRPLVILLDDGTGCLDCAYFQPDKDALFASLGLGDALQVNGTVGVFRGQMQLRCDAVRRVKDVNFETLWINRVIYCSKREGQSEFG
jgi:hypothetical protein